MPSTIGAEPLKAAGFGALMSKELSLQKGQANDSLHGVRSCVGEKSFLFRHDLRLADSKVKKTKAWTRLLKSNQKLNKQRWIYMKARSAMMALGANAEEMRQYQILTPEDVRVSTAVAEPNLSGQRDVSLAWFWTLPEVTGETTGKKDQLLEEGEFLLFCII